jgi:hypothetical protein
MRRADGKATAKCIEDDQGFPDLRRRLSRFQLGKKPDANACGGSELILPQSLRLSLGTNDLTDVFRCHVILFPIGKISFGHTDIKAQLPDREDRYSG